MDYNSYSTYASVTQMQNELRLRTFEYGRADARVIMLFKIIHGLLAIPLPPYFKQPSRMKRHSHPLALRQIHTSVNYYKYSFFPAAVVHWNKLPCSVVTLPTLDQFSVAVRSLDHPSSSSTQTVITFLMSSTLFSNTIIFYSLLFPYSLCTVALRRIQPASKPRYGSLQYRKKESFCWRALDGQTLNAGLAAL